MASYFTFLIKGGGLDHIKQKLIKVSHKETIIEVLQQQSSLIQSKNDLEDVLVNDTSVIDQLDTNFGIIHQINLGTNLVCHLKVPERPEDEPNHIVNNAFDILRQAHRALDYLPPNR